MKFHYYKDTDSLYIDLSEKKSVDSKEISEGIVLDFDVNGKVVGIDIDKASNLVNLSNLEATGIPLANIRVMQA